MNYKGVKDKLFYCQHCGNEFKFRNHANTHTYCNSKCAAQYRSACVDAKAKEQWLNGELKDNSGTRARIRKWLAERDGNNCAVCGCDPQHNNKPLTFWVDHVDGNAENGSPSNFRLICPNCETQSDTFAGRNKGKGYGRVRSTGSYFS
jgi:hypothetical protein